VRYTNDPSNLILPTEATIKHIAKREGLGELTELEWDFLWDLLAKTGGAQVAEFDEDEAAFDAGLHAMLEAETFMQRNPGADRSEVSEKFSEDYQDLQRQLHYLLVALDLNEMPGYNHAAKAIRVIKLLRRAQVLWVMCILEFYVVNALFEMIDTAVRGVNYLPDADLELLRQFVDPLSEEPDEDAKFLGIQLQLGGMDLREVIRIARHLDTLSELQRGRSKLQSDPDGEDMKLRGIRDLSELGRVTQQDLTLPSRLRMKRAVEGELNVRDPHTRRKKKQLLYLVVDGSASMMWDGAVSASRAAGVVMNRLQAVIDGDAEVYIRFFDKDLRKKEYHAKDTTSARELMGVISDPNQYNGGGTVFTSTLGAASVRVQALMKLGHLKEPELVFVTDGDASIPPVSVLKGVKMHVVQVGTEEVTALSDLARESGGISVYAGVPEPV
jgi:hypothetical protein